MNDREKMFANNVDTIYYLHYNINNEIFGIRIILDKKIEFDEIKNYVEVNFEKIKVIYSLRGEYRATHLYFKEDNFSFQWELQIWNKEDEESNINSHKKYKQDYTKWENENKGGKIQRW